MENSPNIEEYLETLARFQETGKEARVKDLSAELNISPASVSQMLSKLQEKKYVEYEKYGRITLTKKGEEVGFTILRKHRLIEKFLRFIGVKKDIHREACKLEHVISDEVENAMIEKMGEEGTTLEKMRNGQSGIILRISGGKNVVGRLNDLGLVPGSRITLTRESRRSGPVEITVRSSKLAIGRGISEKIYVMVDG